MNKKQLKSQSLPRLPSISNQSKLFKTKDSFMQTSKLFIDRFNGKRESVKSQEEDESNKKKILPRSMIQYPKKLNSMGFTSFWAINKQQTSQLLREMRKMKSKSSLLKDNIKAEILFNEIQYQKIMQEQQKMMKEEKTKVIQRIKELTPYKMKKQVKIKQKFKNKSKNVKYITLTMNFTAYQENMQAWKPFFDYDSMPVSIGTEIWFIGGRKHCPIANFNVIDSKWKQYPIIDKLKPFGQCPTTLIKNEKILCFGGYNYFQQGFSLINNTLKIIDLKNNSVEFREFPEKKTPQRAFHSQCIYGQFLIISGGMDKSSKLFNNFMNYNYEKNYWNELAIHKMPKQLKNGFAKHQTLSIFHTRKNYSIYNDEQITEKDPLIKQQGIYIFGGEDSEANLLSNMFIMKLGSPSVVIYQPKIDGKPPIPRRNCRMIRHKDFLIIHGGRNDEMNPFVLNSMHFFSLQTFNWIQVKGQKPPYRYSHSLSVIHGDIVILGGKNTEGLCKQVFVMPFQEEIQYV